MDPTSQAGPSGAVAQSAAPLAAGKAPRGATCSVTSQLRQRDGLVPRPLLYPLVPARGCAGETSHGGFVKGSFQTTRAVGLSGLKGYNRPRGGNRHPPPWLVWMLWANIKRTACALMPRLVQLQLPCTRCVLLCAFGRQPLQLAVCAFVAQAPGLRVPVMLVTRCLMLRFTVALVQAATAEPLQHLYTSSLACRNAAAGAAARRAAHVPDTWKHASRRGGSNQRPGVWAG